MSHQHKYGLCTLAADRGEFVVADMTGSDNTICKTEREARDHAEARWPGAKFALTTLAKVYGEEKTVALGEGRHMVVMAVLGPAIMADGDGSDHPVVGFIGGPVHGIWCVPFTQAVFEGAADKLRR